MARPVLVPPDPTDRERILTFGATGVGKTNGWLSIVARTTGVGYVLDTDGSVLRSTSSDRYRPVRPRLQVATPFDMREAIESVEAWRKSAGPEDWLVIDRIDPLWDMAQEEFSTEVFGSDADEHFLAFRKAAEESEGKTSKSPFDGMQDWPTIKKRHNRVMRAALTWPGHVYMAAGEKELIKGMESTETLADYGSIGYKPAGEKHVGHLTHTILRMQGNNPSTWRVTTIKDRERQQLQGVVIADLATDYLSKVAGWTMEVRE